jgi:hypothetical protein
MAFGFGFGMPRSFAVPPFSPASLFANGEQGWWYDPSNFATLFQDSAGTTPVTAMEQPVGLQLDLSKGLVLGQEYITNAADRDFSSDTGFWSREGNATISGGVANINNVSGTATIYKFNFPNTPGGYVEISFDLVLTAGAVQVLYGTSTSQTLTTSGRVVVRMFSTAVGTFGIRATGGGTALGTIDNISVKELPGNHRFQSTSANRPVVSARVNLLTKTEQFDDAVWTKQTNVSVTPNTVTAPDGTLTADTITWGSASTSTGIFYDVVAGLPTASNTTKSFYVRADVAGGTVELADAQATVGTSTLTLSTSWQQISLTEIRTAGTSRPWLRKTASSPSTIYIWGADLRVTNQGVGLPAYQRVNTSTDYDSTGFPVYIKPNGSNQFMQTNSINFTATDKMTVWQGVRKLLDGEYPILAEFSAAWTANAGTFVLSQNQNNGYVFVSKSANPGTALIGGFLAPITNVVTGIGDISGDRATLRVNGAQVAQSTADQGTGNYGNYPVYFYSRAGSTSFFNGNDYGSIARGAASTAAQITAGETYMAAKTGVTLLVETFDFITTDAGDQIVTDAGDPVISDTYFA